MVTTDDWRPKRTPGRTRGWAKAKENTNADRSQIRQGARNFCLQTVQKANRCNLTREFPHWCKEENSSETIRFRRETIRWRCETIRFGAIRSDTVRDEAIRCETRRSGPDTLRYSAIRDDPSAIRADSGARRFDTGSRKPSACQICNKRCQRGGHHY